MRRSTLVDAIKRIRTDLEEANILEVAQMSMRHRQTAKDDLPFPLENFRTFLLASANYGDSERAILDIFGLGDLLTTDGWEKIWRGADTENASQIFRGVRYLLDYTVPILRLISQDYVSDIRAGKPDIPAELRGKELITAILIEHEGSFSNVERIVYAIQAINELYIVHGHLTDDITDDLIVLACDSGSDKSFDFLGAAKAVEALKETIVFIWNGIVYHRHGQARAAVDVISQSLPVLGQIADMEQAGRLAPELAERLRRKTLGACSKFVEAGVTIPELDRETIHSPRQLMAPERRLLAGPATQDETVAKRRDTRQSAPEEAGLHDMVADIQRRLKEQESRTSSRASRTKKKGLPRAASSDAPD